jgi:hypothetical protein
MFGLFKKKEPSIHIINKVWMTENAKWNACLQLLAENSNVQFVAWFEDTRKKLNELLEQHNHQHKVILYRQAISSQKLNYTFAEHYPLHSKEVDLFKQLELTEVTILNSLDEPLFKQFSSENLIPLLEKLGMQPNEMIEHDIINSSINRTQEKVAGKVSIENAANNQTDWLFKNMK